MEMTAPDSWLAALLAPLAPLLARPDVTDIWVNRPGEAFVEGLGGRISQVAVPGLDEAHLWQLARQCAAVSHQGLSRAQPLLAATLPGGARVQVVAPPATRAGLVMAIRKQVQPGHTLADYAADGGFGGLAAPVAALPPMPDLADGAAVAAYLAAMVRARANIVVAGGTGSGKTTLLNALLREVPPEERLVLIEDTPELELGHRNAVGLVAARGGGGEAQVGAAELLLAALRLRPDRIILGELRGAEAMSFLRAVNSGHPGSLTCLHADSPEGALEQMALMVLEAGTPLRRADLLDYIAATVQLVVQLERHGAQRRVSRLWRPR